MTSRDYWKTRSLNLEKLLHNRSAATVHRIAELYDRAEKELTGQIGKVFSAYVRGGSLNEKKAMQLLSVRETAEAREALREQYQQATGQAKQDIWARLAAPAYANRISRIQALRDTLFAHSRELAAEEERLTRERLIDTLEQSYQRLGTPPLAAMNRSSELATVATRGSDETETSANVERLEELLEAILTLLKELDPVKLDPESLRKYFIRVTNRNTQANGGRCELMV